jgi:hypothetical protein
MGEKEKVNVDIKSAYRLLHPMHTVLVSCIGKTGKPNIATLAPKVFKPKSRKRASLKSVAFPRLQHNHFYFGRLFPHIFHKFIS